MYNIKTFNTIDPAGLVLLEKECYKFDESDPDAILLRSFKLPESEITSTVKAIARAGAGVNNIPVQYCSKRGIVVFNTPGANANSVKELVIAALLLSSRRIHEAMKWTELQQADDGLRQRIEREKSSFAGNEIAGKTLGVIGLGAIGVLVANTAVDLGMTVYGYDPFISVNAAWGLSRSVKRCDELHQMMTISDYITLHVPYSPKTAKLINAEKLNKAKKGLRILNFSREGLVDPEAIEAALKEGKISRYVTDFPSTRLLGVEGVLNIPHLGASTQEAESNCAQMAVRQIKDYLECGNIVNSVNFPSSTLPPSGDVRLLVANENIPNMLSQILEILAKEGLNIEEMVNRHRNGIAYNIIDISAQRISDSSLKQIDSIDGILMTRQIRLS